MKCCYETGRIVEKVWTLRERATMLRNRYSAQFFFLIYVRKSLRMFKALRIRERVKQQFTDAVKVSVRLIVIRCFVVYNKGRRHDSIHITPTVSFCPFRSGKHIFYFRKENIYLIFHNVISHSTAAHFRWHYFICDIVTFFQVIILLE